MVSTKKREEALLGAKITEMAEKEEEDQPRSEPTADAKVMLEIKALMTYGLLEKEASKTPWPFDTGKVGEPRRGPALRGRDQPR